MELATFREYNKHDVYCILANIKLKQDNMRNPENDKKLEDMIYDYFKIVASNGPNHITSREEWNKFMSTDRQGPMFITAAKEFAYALAETLPL